MAIIFLLCIQLNLAWNLILVPESSMLFFSVNQFVVVVAVIVIFFTSLIENFFFRSIAKLETLSNAGQHDAFSFLWRSYHSSWSRSQCMNWSRWWKFSEISKWPYLSRYLLALHSKKLKTLLYLVEGLDTPVIKSSKLLHG